MRPHLHVHRIAKFSANLVLRFKACALNPFFMFSWNTFSILSECLTHVVKLRACLRILSHKWNVKGYFSHRHKRFNENEYQCEINVIHYMQTVCESIQYWCFHWHDGKTAKNSHIQSWYFQDTSKLEIMNDF